MYAATLIIRVTPHAVWWNHLPSTFDMWLLQCLVKSVSQVLRAGFTWQSNGNGWCYGNEIVRIQISKWVVFVLSSSNKPRLQLSSPAERGILKTIYLEIAGILEGCLAGDYLVYRLACSISEEHHEDGFYYRRCLASPQTITLTNLLSHFTECTRSGRKP